MLNNLFDSNIVFFQKEEYGLIPKLLKKYNTNTNITMDQLYLKIAQEHSCTPSFVERNVRNCILHVLSNEIVKQNEDFQRYFQYYIKNDKVIGNAEFIKRAHMFLIVPRYAGLELKFFNFALETGISIYHKGFATLLELLTMYSADNTLFINHIYKTLASKHNCSIISLERNIRYFKEHILYTSGALDNKDFYNYFSYYIENNLNVGNAEFLNKLYLFLADKQSSNFRYNYLHFILNLGLSTSQKGFTLLFELIEIYLQNNNLTLTDMYKQLSVKHNCSFISVGRNIRSIKFQILEKLIEDPSYTKQFNCYAVNMRAIRTKKFIPYILSII